MPPTFHFLEDPVEDATIRIGTQTGGSMPLDDDQPTLVAKPADGIDETPLFGRYRSERELGRGGMGVVIRAHDLVLDIPVALKLVPETVVRDTDGIVELKKEVLRGMELTHPNIVRVFSFEQNAKSAVIVMECVEGESLAQKKARRPARCFDCNEILPWLEQLCAALDYAHHEARIAHRDLKPGNLMLTPAGRLKVADFGIASSLSETLGRVSIRMDSAGTPSYMSPQQVMGERPSHLDDIYSLGATFYELLTSKPPFFRGNVLAQVMHEAPASMAARREELGVTGCEPIPAEWERVIAACLSKAPESRPDSGAAVIEMLKLSSSSLVPSPAVSGSKRPLEIISAPEPIQAIDPKPVAKANVTYDEAKTVEVVSRPRLNLQPLVTAGSVLVRGISAIIQGLTITIGAILRPLLKLGLALAVLWGLLHLKQKWDDGQAKRDALAAKQEAANRSAALASGPAPAPRPQIIVLPPPPPGGGPGPQGMRPPLRPPPRRP